MRKAKQAAKSGSTKKLKLPRKSVTVAGAQRSIPKTGASRATSTSTSTLPPHAAPPVTAPTPDLADKDDGAPEPRTAMAKLKARWGVPAIDAGWTALPSVLLEKQAALQLDPTDINIILHIAKHWWEADRHAHPSKGSIAKAMQVSPRHIQKRIKALEEAKFIKRIPRWNEKGSLSSEYDLSGLVKAVEGFAKEALIERAAKKKMTAERIHRKRPKVEHGGEAENS
ncbi:MAG: helix-turn-helix domain-containing protein [Labilithrix sp.]|nr:helix-turn-helix domain-containing protein [Labilithrix sp.]